MSTKYKFRDSNGIYFISPTVVHWNDLFTRKEFKHIVVDWLETTEEVFCKLFRKPPLKRAKYAGLKRNIDFANGLQEYHKQALQTTGLVHYFLSTIFFLTKN